MGGEEGGGGGGKKEGGRVERGGVGSKALSESSGFGTRSSGKVVLGKNTHKKEKSKKKKKSSRDHVSICSGRVCLTKSDILV